MALYDILLKFPIRLFFVLTPVAAIAVFLGLTTSCSTKERVRVAVQATSVAFIILVIAALTGPLLFTLFHLSVSSFQVAGGVYLSMLGYSLLRPDGSISESRNDNVNFCNCAITPLAMPLLAGPGTISYIFLVRSQLSSVVSLVCFLFSIFVTMLVIAIIMILVAKIARMIPGRIISFLSIIMGVIITCMGVQIVVNGVRVIL